MAERDDRLDQLSLANQEISQLPELFPELTPALLEYAKKAFTWAEKVRMPLRDLWDEAYTQCDYILLDKIEEAFEVSYLILHTTNEILEDIEAAEESILLKRDLNEHLLLCEMLSSVIAAAKIICEIILQKMQGGVSLCFYLN